MGISVTKPAAKDNRVRPVTAISVQPAPSEQPSSPSHFLTSSSNSNTNNNSLNSSVRRLNNKCSSEDTLKKSPSRPDSSRTGSLSKSSIHHRGAASGLRNHSAKRFGGASRPISGSRQTSAGRTVGFHGIAGTFEKLQNPTTSGLPLQRDLDIPVDDFNTSLNRSHRFSHIDHFLDEDVIVLGRYPDHNEEQPATKCQLCGNSFTNLGIRVPLLLLCGHSYCSSCIEKACESYLYPAAVKCGICKIITPLDQQTPDSLPQNESILDLIGSKEYISISSDKNHEMCAECERKVARMYCSDCLASYCESCSKRAHEGSRVRSKHKPVSINLKPRPQPTCKKHPGQSCVLYCETEKQPMCVLCKFYNQHRFHKFDLMLKVATNYSNSVTERLNQLDKLERELGETAQLLSNSVDEINSNARKAQERLERHFIEIRNDFHAALERREAELLTLVDRQVEVKQEMLGELRLEVAAARAKVLAAREEARKLLQLNAITALLSRKHMDVSFDRALKQTLSSNMPTIPPDVPLSLLPNVMPNLMSSLEQHGAILQLPPKPDFESIRVTTNTISLEWKMPSPSTGVSLDRTLTYSLHCFADIPAKLKVRLGSKKRMPMSLFTPESGFEDMSDLSNESKSTFMSLPPSALGKRMTLSQQLQTTNRNPELRSEDPQDKERASTPTKVDEDSQESEGHLVLKPSTAKNISSLLPEPIRLPKAIGSPSAESTSLAQPPVASSMLRPKTEQGQFHSGALLNLPPLIVNKPSTPAVNTKGGESETELLSVTTSGIFADSEDDTPASTRDGFDHDRRMSTVDEDTVPDHSEKHRVSKTDSSESAELSTTSEELSINEHTNLGRLCCGYAFEEIYCGEQVDFRYSGLVAGASYYFRVRCHNAAGWGPWSDTVKCMTTLN